MSKKKVYGVEFKEPYTRHEDLKDENVYDTGPAIASLFLSIIPIIGIGMILASYFFAMKERKDNKFGLAEVAWKSAVYGMLIQIISLIVFFGVIV